MSAARSWSTRRQRGGWDVPAPSCRRRRRRATRHRGRDTRVTPSIAGPSPGRCGDQSRRPSHEPGASRVQRPGRSTDPRQSLRPGRRCCESRSRRSRTTPCPPTARRPRRTWGCRGSTCRVRSSAPCSSGRRTDSRRCARQLSSGPSGSIRSRSGRRRPPWFDPRDPRGSSPVAWSRPCDRAPLERASRVGAAPRPKSRRADRRCVRDGGR